MRFTVRNKKLFCSLLILFSLCTSIFSQTADKNLLDEIKKDGISFYWDSLSNTGILEKNGQHITFRPDQNFVLLNSSKVIYTDSPVITDGVLKVTNSFLTFNASL